jgi:hypothetical protein
MYDLQFSEIAMNTWAMFRQTWIAVNKVAEVRLAKADLTPEKAAVLWACRDYPGTITPAEIARLTFREGLVADVSTDEQEQLQKLLRVLRDKMLDELHMEIKKPSGHNMDKPISPGW